MISLEILPLGWALIHFVWQAALIAAVLMLLLQLFRPLSSQTRYLLQCAALLLMALCPLITLNVLSNLNPRESAAKSNLEVGNTPNPKITLTDKDGLGLVVEPEARAAASVDTNSIAITEPVRI
jgi:hypothetical protein